MTKLKVFYHVYIPDDMRACAWTWFVDQQLMAIKKSHLCDIAEIHICVTMPCGWIDFFGCPIYWDNSNQPTTFGCKFQEYTRSRYPWANILHMRDTAEPNLFEGITLKQLHTASFEEDFYALYIHTKGIVPQASASISTWREILNYYLIEKWPHNVKLLNDFQVVAINDSHSAISPIVSGNFFWARSDYIKTLSDPLKYTEYAKKTEFDQMHLRRYAYELWILSKDPQVNYITNTNVNHYGTYCFLENLPQ